MLRVPTEAEVRRGLKGLEGWKRAGISVEAGNKWLTLIQNAAHLKGKKA